MSTLKKYWSNFKTQPDVWFFCGFLLAWTLSLRKVLNFFPIQDQFNEYAGIYLYVSDVFLILVLVFWLLSIIYNKNSILSILKTYRVYVVLPFLLVLWAFLSIFWSQNTEIALFRAIKTLELYLLYLYLGFRLRTISLLSIKNNQAEQIVPRGTISKCFTCLPDRQAWNIFFKIIIIVALVQSVIAILQFIFQHSIGIFWLKESVLSADMSGVAKVILGGDKFIRAYGLFPHPNILGGFLVFSIILTALYYKMFHVEQNSVFLGLKCSTWNILILVIQILVLILTFSKSAMFGLAVACTCLYLKNVPRGTFFINFGKYLKYALIIMSLILLLLFMLKLDFYAFFIKSLVERDLYINVSRGTILANFWTGVGIGQFVPLMQNYSKQILEIWQFQPVHNVFLLIWSELGFVGLSLFIYFVYILLVNKNVPRGTFLNTEECCPQVAKGINVDNQVVTYYFKVILVAFLFIMLFDHYFWDIQQGQVLFWMVAGLVVASREG